VKNVLAVEVLKLKRSKIIWIVLLAPCFISLQGAINLLRYYDLFTGQGQNVWQQLYTQSILFYVMILFPVLISIVMALIARIENAHHGWKYYLSLPVNKQQIYIVKFCLGCGFLFVNVLALITSMLLAGKVIGIQEAVPYDVIVIRPLLTYVAALPLMALLYFLSMRFAQMTVPLAVGIGLSLPAILVANTRFWALYPWTYPIMAALGGNFDKFDRGGVVYIAGVILMLAVFAFGYREFKQRDVF